MDTKIIIIFVSMRRCIKCRCKKNEDNFYYRKGRLDNICKICHRKYRKSHYLKNIEKYKVKAYKSRKIIRERNRKYLINYFKSHPCVDCGSTDIRVLEFDHLRNKIIEVSRLINGKLEKIINEIKKCEVVCANCHKIRTAERGNFWTIKI